MEKVKGLRLILLLAAMATGALLAVSCAAEQPTPTPTATSVPVPTPTPTRTPVATPTPISPTPPPGTLAGVKVSSGTQRGLKLEVSISKVEFGVGEPIEVNLSILNTTSDKVSFSTRTSQLFDLVARAPKLEKEPRWSEGLVFAQVITPRTIDPQGVLSEKLSWRVNIAAGEVSIVGLTSPLVFDGKETMVLETPAIKITIR